MGYYSDLQTELDSKHVDDDLAYLFEHFGEVSLGEIEDVLAVWEGQNDRDSWRWIIATTDHKFLYYSAWCDYTGWGCQDGSELTICESRIDALTCEPDIAVREDLFNQVVKGGRSEVWTDTIDMEDKF